jgi:general secretion pathway protein D
MSIKPPVICACALAAAGVTPTPIFAGNSQYAYSQYSDTAAQGIADRAIARREEDVRRARAAIESGDAAMKQRDYETAFAQYKAASDLLPESDVTHKLRREALDGLCDAACSLAEQRIASGRYEDARNLCKAVLDDRYDPNCHRAIVILAHLEDPDYYNKTITPRFRGDIEEVKNLFDEAKGYEMSGRYDKAYQDYDKILNLDPYNVAARKGQEEVNGYRDHYSNQAYEETRSQLLWQLDNGWQMPVHKFGVKGTENFNPTTTDVRHTEYITNKLNRIIIPKIEFRDATVREAVDFLKEKSRDLDTQEPDPTRRGVNIVLQLDTGEAAPPPAETAPVTPAAPAIPGLEAAPAAGALPAAVPATPAAPAVSSAEARITLSLSNIPLIEALKYICQLANLKLKIDPYAVSIVPPSVNTDELITKEYKVPAGFMSTAPNISGASSLSAPAARGGAGGGETAGVDSSGAGGQIVPHQSAMDYLTSQGVQFPPGSNAVYFPGSSRLIVHNTASNIELIDAIVESSQPAVPTQVSIEAKFVEIQQNNQKELSGSVLVGQFNLPGQHTIFAAGGTTGNGTPLNASDFPLPFPSSGPLQEQPLTAGLRSGSYAISADAIDALLNPSANGSASAPAILGIGSIMSDPTFQAVLRGLDQKKGIDLLDAPRVTTKSGQRAVIEIVREFRYPTEFDPPQIPQNFGATGSVALGATAPIEVFPVTPTTPTAFETRNTGVTLEVEPTVGSDNYTIDLNLVPQVVEFEGFINYGSPISTINPASLGLGGVTGAITNAPASVVLTPNTINQPIFSTRKVTTEVTVWDGQTVVLGGLMEDDVQKVQDKVPILGDIPLIGRAFRSNVDQHLKTNLVIFVTTHLINPAGDNILDLEEKDETVEPLPLPSAPVQPAPEAPLFQK